MQIIGNCLAMPVPEEETVGSISQRHPSGDPALGRCSNRGPVRGLRRCEGHCSTGGEGGSLWAGEGVSVIQCCKRQAAFPTFFRTSANAAAPEGGTVCSI